MELKSKRILRHPCWCLTSTEGCTTMDPHKRFCHNERCWAYGRAGEGHIVIHSRKEHRYRFKRCGRTFSATKGTALCRAHNPHELGPECLTSSVPSLMFGSVSHQVTHSQRTVGLAGDC